MKQASKRWSKVIEDAAGFLKMKQGSWRWGKVTEDEAMFLKMQQGYWRWSKVLKDAAMLSKMKQGSLRCSKVLEEDSNSDHGGTTPCISFLHVSDCVRSNRFLIGGLICVYSYSGARTFLIWNGLLIDKKKTPNKPWSQCLQIGIVFFSSK